MKTVSTWFICGYQRREALNKLLISGALSFVLAFPLLSTGASASSPVPAGFATVGSGELTWFGLSIYEATLYAPAGSFDPGDGYALRIDYKRTFSRSQLAKTSLKEMEKIFGDKADDEKIISRLEEVFCDVRKGDYIIGLHNPGQGAEFFCGDHAQGRLENKELAAAFFAIWLNPATSAPKLRRQLLGLAP